MDIAKIRKKAKEQEGGKPQEEQPLSQAVGAEVPPLSEIGSETGQEDVPAASLPSAQSAEPQAQGISSDIAKDVEEDRIELLTFSLATEEFAFKVTEVEEILRPQNITTVPSMPEYMRGITSLRGKIIPVIDLKVRLNLNRTDPAGPEGQGKGIGKSAEKILIIDGPKGFIGASVDRVIGVVGVLRGDVLDPPAHLTEAEMKFIEGIVILDKRFISVVNSADTMKMEIG